MKALTVSFNLASNDYERLLNVLIASWKENAIIPLEVIRIPAPDLGKRSYPYVANTTKLEVWAENFTEDTIFIDCDMLCLDCPSSGFDLVDYAGITDREDVAPINGGVMFFKYTKKAKQFMRDLVRVNQEMMDDIKFHKEWQQTYAGMNQSAIGYLWENDYKDLTLLPKEYNLCEPWSDWEQAKLVHIKGSRLRRTCINDHKGGEPHLQDIKRKWQSYEGVLA